MRGFVSIPNLVPKIADFNMKYEECTFQNEMILKKQANQASSVSSLPTTSTS